MNFPSNCNAELNKLLQQTIHDQLKCSNCEVYAFMKYQKKESKSDLMNRRFSRNIKGIATALFLLGTSLLIL